MTVGTRCQNCGKQFTPSASRRSYCGQPCVDAAANRRRRTRRHLRKPAQQVITCFCLTCEVEFPATAENLTEHSDDECYWHVIDETPRPCVAGCGKTARREDMFCGENCFVKVGNRLIPHDPRTPLTADDITWSPYFDQIMH
jgi:hypothetical protein